MARNKLKALHYHAARGRYSEVQSLLKEGIDIDGKDSYGRTPLMKAAQQAHREVFELLINCGADIHSCDNHGWTVVHHASYNKNSTDIVQCLVMKGVDLEVKDIDSATPLMIAAQRSYREVVELLIDSAADIHSCDDRGLQLLHYASKVGWLDIVKHLLNERVSANVRNYYGLTPLMMAVGGSCRKTVEVLIDAGADVHCSDFFSQTVLGHAVTGGSVEIVQLLVNKGVTFDMNTSSGQRPSMIAAAHGVPREVVERLVGFKPDINCCDGSGWQGIHNASDQGCIGLVQLFLKEGADINARTSKGETPLYFAVETYKYKIEIVEYLLKEGADCNLENNDGESPFTLLLKGRRNNPELIKLCIEKGAFVNCTDYNNMLLDPSLNEAILTDVKLCSQAIINKFNNKDLPLLYNKLASPQKIPNVNQLKIGKESSVVLVVEQAVTHEMQSKGFCNLIETAPLVLRMLCVKSFLKETRPALNPENMSKSQDGLKRLLYSNEQEHPCKKRI